MPIVYPKVKNLDTLADLLAWPATEGPINRIQIERSSIGGGVGFANIGSVTLIADTLDYTFYDTTGVNSDWFRWYFSNAANSFPSSPSREYSPEVQPGDESAGLLCDVFDVKQEMGKSATDSSQDESIAQKIGEVSAAIMGYTGRRFARTPASGTTTYLFDIARHGRILRVPQGIAEMTTLEVAVSSQPETGGTYTTVPTTDWFLRPVVAERDFGWPATSVEISDLSSNRFYAGYNVARLTMALGFTAVPLDIRGMAIRASVSNVLAKGSGRTGEAFIGPNGAMMVLRDLSPTDMRRLDWYAHKPVG